MLTKQTMPLVFENSLAQGNLAKISAIIRFKPDKVYYTTGAVIRIRDLEFSNLEHFLIASYVRGVGRFCPGTCTFLFKI